jgi:hypothetical protein
MPCLDERNSNEYFLSNANEEIKVLHEKCNRLTVLLCNACRQLEEKNGNFGVLLDGAELSKWWQQHKAKDRQMQEAEDRERAEKLKQQEETQYLQSVKTRLMSQLTDDEKRALGISF